MITGLILSNVALIALSSFYLLKYKKIESEQNAILTKNEELDYLANNAMSEARKEVAIQNKSVLAQYKIDFENSCIQNKIEFHDATEKAKAAYEEATLKAKAKFEDMASNYRNAFLIENTHIVSQAIADHQYDAIEREIESLMANKYQKAGQEFLACVTEQAETATKKFENNIVKNIWDSCQQFIGDVDEDGTPLVYPTGTKLAYTKGTRTVIIIEEPPQLRSVTFSNGVLCEKDKSSKKPIDNEGNRRFTLAFPYVYFMIVFESGEYSYHQVYFRNKPIASAREYLYLAPLPNVWRNKGEIYKPVCMGASFQVLIEKEKTLSKKCQLTISEFWQKTFTNDLKSVDLSKIDERIKNFSTWEKNSEKDEFFILDVSWEKGKPVGTLIENACFGNNKLSLNIRSTLDNNVKFLEKTIQKTIQNYSGFITDFTEEEMNVRNKLSDALITHTKNVFEVCERQYKDEYSSDN